MWEKKKKLSSTYILITVQREVSPDLDTLTDCWICNISTLKCLKILNIRYMTLNVTKPNMNKTEIHYLVHEYDFPVISDRFSLAMGVVKH